MDALADKDPSSLQEDLSSPTTDGPQQKGDYLLVSGLANEDDNDEEEALQQQHDCSVVGNVDTTTSSFWDSWNRNWMPDVGWSWRGITILELEAVRFLKFLSWTLIGIVVVHYLVKWLNWEHDADYNLTDMILYDFNLMVLDVLVFFVVGRLFRQRSVDYASWILTAFISAFYTSWSTNFKFLQYSFSLYEMHCHWPWKLWVFCLVLVPLVVLLVWLHAKVAFYQGTLVRRSMELALSILFFIIPYASHPNFHLHHWYLGFLLGMHASLDTWWSRATMAWCWGFYVNGVAVYGRDPILTCALAYYQSTDQHCPYMACYVPHHQDDNATAHEYKPMVEPNWRNCTGYIP